jgi:hypothetical protein
MPNRRFQFRVGQLLKLIVLCALVFALVRTPFAPLVVMVCIVLPGFIIGRRNGGNGILGGTVAGCLAGGIAAVAILFVLAFSRDAQKGDLGVALLFGPPSAIFWGTLFGAMISVLLLCFTKFVQHVGRKPLRDGARGPFDSRRSQQEFVTDSKPRRLADH